MTASVFDFLELRRTRLPSMVAAAIQRVPLPGLPSARFQV